jgi:hypothetical protein
MESYMWSISPGDPQNRSAIGPMTKSGPPFEGTAQPNSITNSNIKRNPFI